MLNSHLKSGSLLVAQDDIVDFLTGEVLIKKGAHMMYLKHLENHTRDFGHKVIDSTTLKKFVIDTGVEFVDADDTGALFVVRAKHHDLPMHARHVHMDGTVRV